MGTQASPPPPPSSLKTEALQHLLREIETGWASAEREGWLSEEDVWCTLNLK